MDIVVVSVQRQAEAFVVAFVVVLGELCCSPPIRSIGFVLDVVDVVLGWLLGGCFIWLGRRMT